MKKIISKCNCVCVAMILAASLIGCGSSETLKSTASIAYDTNEGAAQTDDVYATTESTDESFEVATEEQQSDTGTSAKSEDLSNSVATNRKLIKKVELSVETQEFEDITSKIEKKVESLGGYMETSNIYGNRYNNNSPRRADYVARVPVSKLNEMVTAVSDITNIINKSESATDITLSYVDTKSQKESLEIEQERLMAILAQAQDVETIVALETKLTDVRYQIQSLESQLRTFDNLVDFATVSIHIEEVEIYTPDTVEKKSDLQRMIDGFVNSLQNVLSGIKNFIIDLIIALPYLIIWALIILLIIGIVRVIIKKNRKKKNRRLNGNREESGVRDDNRKTKCREIDTDESIDRSEDSNHIEQTSDN